MKKLSHIFKITNAYTHDFASALWLATVMVVYWINRSTPPSGSEDFFFGMKKEFFIISIISLVTIMVTGVGRTATYSSGVFGDDSEESRKKLLIIKHILGMLIYGAGTFWQYRMVFG